MFFIQKKKKIKRREKFWSVKFGGKIFFYKIKFLSLLIELMRTEKDCLNGFVLLIILVFWIKKIVLNEMKMNWICCFLSPFCHLFFAEEIEYFCSVHWYAVCWFFDVDSCARNFFLLLSHFVLSCIFFVSAYIYAQSFIHISHHLDKSVVQLKLITHATSSSIVENTRGE